MTSELETHVTMSNPQTTAKPRYMLHELKTWPGPFRDVKAGRKTFEYRRNDRDFNEGDDLLLREWAPDSGYSGQEILVSVGHLVRGPDFGIADGFVCMSIKRPFSRFRENANAR